MTPSPRPAPRVECAICAAYGQTHDYSTPLETAREIPHDRCRDGLTERTVYACPECAAMIDDTPPPAPWARSRPVGEGGNHATS